MTNECSPWDPRCLSKPKPELFVSLMPNGSHQIFQTIEAALNYLRDECDEYPGTIHKIRTEIVYYDKECLDGQDKE